jgi:N-acylneuraminate cytidylyltransferase
LHDTTIALELPETEVQDIDNEDDWKLAEFKYKFFMNR